MAFGIYECFTLSAFLKIFESIAVFTCLMLHRIGNSGKQVFFAANDMVLDNDDVIDPTEVDAEILGAGTLMAFTIISPLMLLAYAVEGRKVVQSTHLDPILSFVAAGLLLSAGGWACFAWNNVNFENKLLERRIMESAGALAILTTLTGVLYLVDFFYLIYQHAYHTASSDGDDY